MARRRTRKPAQRRRKEETKHVKGFVIIPIDSTVHRRRK